MLLVTSPTVRDALVHGIRFQQLTHLTGEMSFKQAGHRIALCYCPSNLQDQLGQLVAQAEISGTYKFIQDLYKMMGLSVPEVRIELPFPKPEELKQLQLYHDYYGHQVQFNADQAAFWFDEAVLNVKIPSADEMTFKLYEKKCIAELERLREDEKDTFINPTGAGLSGAAKWRNADHGRNCASIEYSGTDLTAPATAAEYQL